MSAPSSYARIYAVVRRIPKGRVATYGQIAELAGIPRHARQVGYALAALRDARVPWHRVLNARGEISARSEPGPEALQRVLLEREGVAFDPSDRVSLRAHLWQPRLRRARARPRRVGSPRRVRSLLAAFALFAVLAGARFVP